MSPKMVRNGIRRIICIRNPNDELECHTLSESVCGVGFMLLLLSSLNQCHH